MTLKGKPVKPEINYNKNKNRPHVVILIKPKLLLNQSVAGEDAL